MSMNKKDISKDTHEEQHQSYNGAHGMHRLYTGVHYYLQVCHEPAIANQLYYYMRKATPKTHIS